jgi:clan AA aspartic protease
MITGIITPYNEAVISLRVQGNTEDVRSIEGIIDTGFTGFLTLLSSLIHALNLPWRRRGLAILADGTETIFDIYEATVFWDGQPRRIAVDTAETDPLIGMSLLKGYEMTMRVVEGGRVIITAI